ncbi:MAG: ABC-F family ATP-binding cassette domain-containing protein [Anaerovoracaceae bacterium]|nr:ABC-F family ATP-binding cassette domain-containing protein [Bacillota bacterium]MDY2670776.1 ABC-F family ATP-binding cassette domain-containing protein [Anaerovoracaceae bacterium]
MILVNADNISKSYTEKPLLTGVNLSIHEGEKVGLIGVNGTGKSTLLRIIAGAEEPDSGKVTYTNNIKKAYLPQNPDYEGKLTVSEQAARYLEMLGGNTPDYICRSMMTKLGINDFDAQMGTLSGGQRKRVALAAVLCVEADLIILDEPTNHMDNGVIDWLEDYLTSYKGAVFMITHDRYFLDRVTRRIVEIDNGSLYSYEGNYDYYLEAKAAREESALASERKRATLYKKELAWIRRGARARSTKAKSHIERFEELRDSKLIIDKTEMNMDAASSRLGKKIIEIENVSKSYEDRKLIDDFSYTVLRNDRIGIIGDNGSGKSTLLKMIVGQIKPDSGTITIGETVKIGYFSQESEDLDPDQRVIKYAEGISDNVKTSDGYMSASQMLERFLFPSIKHSVRIGQLSGGEKRRLSLLGVLMQAPNVLIFDEPTNDLDISTLTVLEDYLDSFAGAVIIVSHDRYFLDRLCVRTFSFEGNGVIRMYNGGYTDTMKMKEYEELKKELEEKPAKKAEKKSVKREHQKKLKFTYMEQKEYETIDDDIAELEEKIADVDRQLAAESGTSDYKKLQELTDERSALNRELDEKTDRWVYLNELAEKIEQQRG